MESLLLRNLSYVRRFTGGNENLNTFIDYTFKVVNAARMMQTALLTLHAIRMATGDPLAWATAITAVVGIGISGYDIGTSIGQDISTYEGR